MSLDAIYTTIGLVLLFLLLIGLFFLERWQSKQPPGPSDGGWGH